MPADPDHALYRELLAAHRGGPAGIAEVVIGAVPLGGRSWGAPGVAPIAGPEPGPAAVTSAYPGAHAVVLVWADLDSACAESGPAAYGQLLVAAGDAAHTAAAAAERAGFRAEVRLAPCAALARGSLRHLCSAVLTEDGHG